MAGPVALGAVLVRGLGFGHCLLALGPLASENLPAFAVFVGESL